MADTQTSFGYAASPRMWEESALDSVAKEANVGAALIHNIDIDNQSNAIVYVKVYYKAAGDVVVGTTDPDEIIPVPTLTRQNHVMIQASDAQMPTAITLAAVTTGGTAGTSNPAGGSVAVRVTIE